MELNTKPTPICPLLPVEMEEHLNVNGINGNEFEIYIDPAIPKQSTNPGLQPRFPIEEEILLITEVLVYKAHVVESKDSREGLN